MIFKPVFSQIFKGDWLRNDSGKTVPRNGKYETAIKWGKTSKTTAWGQDFVIKRKLREFIT